jgi:hypothetical protein
MGFQQSPHEAAVYRRGKDGNALLVGLYVGDLVITGTKEAKVDVSKEMKATFQMSNLGLLSFYHGIEVHQDSYGISLTAYAKRIIDLGACTPMERLKLSHNSMAKEVDAIWYRRIVGNLCYLVYMWPDMAFAVGYISRFMQRPTTEHQRLVAPRRGMRRCLFEHCVNRVMTTMNHVSFFFLFILLLERHLLKFVVR